MTDEELVSQYKSNSSMEIIAELYIRYGHLVFGTVMKYIKNTSNTEDITMQLFEKLGDKIKQSEIRSFKSWLYTVTKNEAFQFLRKSKEITSELKVELEASYDLTMKIVEEKQFKMLEREIQQLNTVQRDCIILFYMEQKSYQEIASLTSLTLKKVKSAIQNGKRNLKLKLENNEAFK